MKRVLLLVFATVGAIFISIASTTPTFPLLYNKVSDFVATAHKETVKTLSKVSAEEISIANNATKKASQVSFQHESAPPCQPFEIQAIQISPNEKCDGGLDNGIGEAGMIPPTPLPADNMVGDWRFDGNFQDSEPAGGNSRMRANPKKDGPTFISSELGGAIQFDGVEDYAAMTGPQYSLNNYQRVTIANWIQTSSSSEQVIVSYDEDEYWELRVNTSGQIEWAVNTDAGPAVLTSTTVVNDGVWHHVVASFDEGLLSIYIDGRLDAQMTQGTLYGSGNTRYGVVGIGSEARKVDGDIDISSGFFNGNIDEMKLYDSALTPEQILDIYFSGTPYIPVSVDDLTFRWYAGTDTSVPPIATGLQAQNLAEGNYTVIAEDNLTGCFSNPAQVTIDRVIPTLNAVIWETQAYTTCNAPNGALEAGVVVGTDTLSTGYDFVWYETDFLLTGDSISISNVASNLSARSYSVVVSDPVSGCETTLSMSVSSNVSLPIVSAQVTQQIISCSDPDSGAASANVGGNTTNYSFTWYEEGSNAAIASTPTINGIPAGRYSVVATSNATGCASSPATVEIENQSTAPNIETTVTEQSSCAFPNGSLSAAAIVSGNPTTSGYSFYWYQGFNNVTPAKSGYTGGPDVDGLAAGNYRVVVTHDATGCSSYQDVTITETLTYPVLSLDTQNNILLCGISGGDATVSVDGDPTAHDFYWFTGSVSSPDTTNTSQIVANGTTANALAPGTYTIYSANKTTRCLSNAIQITITDETTTTLINTETISTQTSCDPAQPNGIMRATVDASAYGGGTSDTVGYTFEWYSGTFTESNLPGTTYATGATVQNVEAGSYTIVVTNSSNACYSIAYHTMAEDLIYPNFDAATVVQPTACADPWGSSISVTVNSGLTEADGFTFTWTDVTNGTTLSETSASVANLAPGDYSVVATSDVGCASAPMSFTLDEITNPFTIDVTEVQPQTSCATPNGELQALIAGTASGYDFQWFSGSISLADAATASPIATNSTASALATGDYTVVATSQSNSCQQIAYGTVTENILLPVIDNSTSIVQPDACADPWGSAISVTVNSGLTEADGFTFTWTDVTNGTTLAETSASVTNLAPGDYSVVATSDVGCTSAPMSFTLDEVTNPFTIDVTEVQPQTSCATPSGELQALIAGTASGYDFQWFSGSISLADAATASPIATNSTASALATGDYTVVATSQSNSCQQIAYGTVTENILLPVIDNSTSIVQPDACADPWGSAISVTVNSGLTEADGFSFTWTDVTNGTTLSETSASVANLAPGDYSVIATSNVGCTSAPMSFTLDEITNPFTIDVTEVQPQTSCATPNGELQALIAGTASGYDFQWFSGSISLADAATASPIATNNTASALAAGDYTVVATSQSTSCQQIAYGTVTENILLPVIDNSASITQPDACADPWGSAISVTVNSGLTEADGFSFTWTDVTNGTTLAETSASVANLAPGDYSVIATSNVGCTSAPMSFTLDEVTNPFNIDVTEVQTQSSCDPANPNGELQALIAGTASGYDFQWFSGSISLTDATTASPIANTSTASGLAAGDYTVVATSQSTSCQQIAYGTVTENILLPVIDNSASITQPDACADPWGSAISVTVNSGLTAADGFSFTWTDVTNSTTLPMTTATVTNLPPGQYEVVATSPLACVSAPVSFTLDEITNPFNIDVTEVQTQSSCDPANPNGELQALIAGTASGYDFQWFSGSISLADAATASPIATNNTASALAAGDYTVVATSQSTSCQQIAYGTVTENILLPVIDNSASITQPDACADPWGSAISVTVNSGLTAADGFSFTWTDVTNSTTLPMTTATVTNLPPGQYEVVATSPLACVSAPVSFTLDEITNPFNIDVTEVQTQSSCDPANPNGELQALIAGTASGYDFQWFSGSISLADAATASPIATNNTASALAAGDYTVVATSQSTSCQQIAYGTVTENILLPVIDNSTSIVQPDACADPWGSAISVTVNNGRTEANGYSFTWTDVTNSTTLPMTTATVTNLPPGQYEVVATSPLACVSAPLSFTLDAFTNPFTVDISELQPQSSCDPANPNGELQALIAGTASGYDFQWFSGSISLADAATASPIATNNTASALAAGDYTVVATSQSTSCQQIAYGTVTENILLPVIDNSTSIVQPDACADPWGSAISVTVNNGRTEANGYSFTWTDVTNSTTLPMTTATVTNLPPGQYEVVATSPLACVSAPVSFTLIDESVPPAINLDAFSNTSCNPTTPNGVIEANGFTGSATDYTFEWYINNTSGTQITTNISANGSSVANLDGGTYALRLTSNITQCSNIEYINLLNSPQPPPSVDTVSTTLASSCLAGTQDGEVVLTVSSGYESIPGSSGTARNYTFELSNTNGYANSTISTSDVTFSNLDPGFYEAVVTDNSSGCISDPFTFAIAQKPLEDIVINYVRPTSCGLVGASDGEASIDVNTDTNSPAISGSPGFTFDWIYEVNGSPVIIGTDTDFTSERDLLGPGFYGITVTDLETGCTYYERFLLELDNPPIVSVDNVTDITSCSVDNGEVLFTLNPGPSSNPLNNYRVNLFKGDRVSLIPLQTWFPPATTVDTQHTFAGLDTGQYLIAVQINVSPFCYIAETSFTVGENIPTANISFTKVDDTSCDGSGNGSINASVSGTDGSTDYTLNWYDSANPTVSFSTGNSVSGLGPDNYRLEVIDNSGAGVSCVRDTVIRINNTPINVSITTSKIDVTACDVSNLGSAHISSITENGNPASFADYNITLMDVNNVPLAPVGDGTSASPFTGLNAGTYYLQAENIATGCTSAQSQIRIRNLSRTPQAALSVISPDYGCADPTLATGQLQAAPFGPFDSDTDPANFSFRWFSGQNNTNSTDEITTNLSGTNNQLARQLTAGWYTVEVTDISGNGNGCSVTTSLQVPAVRPAVSLTAAATNPAICFGDGEISVSAVTVNNAAAPTTNLTEFNLILQDDSGNPLQSIDAAISTTFTGVAVGNYRVLAQHKNYSCWPANATALSIIDENEQPQAALSVISPDYGCADPTLATGQLQAAPFGPFDSDTDPANFSFRWFSGQNNTNSTDEITTNLSGTNNQLAGQLTAGWYTVEVTDISGNGNGCSVTTSLQVPAVRPAVSLTAAATNPTICFGDGEISVSAVTVNNAAAPTTNLTEFNLILQDDSGNPLQSIDAAISTTFTGVAVGNYRVLAQHKNYSCWPANATALSIIDENEQPQAALSVISPDYGCADPTLATGQLQAAPFGPFDSDTDPANFSFRWFSGQNNTNSTDEITTNLSGTNNQLAGQLTAGWYTVEVTDISGNGNGCSVTTSLQVPAVRPAVSLTAAATNPTICFGDGEISVSAVTVNNAAAPTTTLAEFNLILQDDSGTLIQTLDAAISTTFTGVAVGNYRVLAQHKNYSCWPANATALSIVDENEQPQAALSVISPDYGCADPTLATGQLQAAPFGPFDSDTDPANFSFRWFSGQNNTNSTDEITTNLSGTNNQLAGQLTAGWYTVEVTDISGNGNGCSVTTSLQVPAVRPAVSLTAAATNPTICFGDGEISVSAVTVNNAAAPTTTLAEFNLILQDDSGTLIQTLDAAISTTFTGVAVGNYRVLAQHKNYSCWPANATALSIIDENEQPQAALSVISPDYGCADPTLATGQLQAAPFGPFDSDTDPANFSFRWFSGQNNTNSTDEITTNLSGTNNQLAGQLTAGWYTVEVTDISGNGNGCSVTTSLQVPAVRPAVSLTAAATNPTICFGDGEISVSAVTVNNAAAPTTTLAEFNLILQDDSGTLIQTLDAAISTTFTGVAVGNYRVLAQHKNYSCWPANATALSIIDENEQPQAALSVISPDYGCADPTLATGQLQAAPFGPFDSDTDPANFSFRWFSGQNNTNSTDEITTNLSGTNNQLAGQLTAGWYTVEVTDISGNGNGCSVTTSLQVPAVRPAVSLTAAATNPTICFGDGEISVSAVTVNNAAAPTTTLAEFNLILQDDSGTLIQTLDAAISTTFTGVAVGNYRVLAQHKNYSCWPANATALSIIDENEQPQAALSVISPDYGCADPTLATGQLQAAPFGPFDSDTDPANFSFRWFSGQNNTNSTDEITTNLSGTNNQLAGQLTAGWYTVEVTDISGNGNGCSVTTSLQVPAVNPSISLTAAATNPTICFGDGEISVSAVTVNNAAAPTTTLAEFNLILQDDSGTLIQTLDAAVSTTFTGVAVGNYRVLAQHKNYSCWPANAITLSIVDENEGPQIYGNIINNLNCVGVDPSGSISVSAEGYGDANTTDFTYTWYEGNTVDAANLLDAANIDPANSANAINLTSGFYTVEVTDTSVPAQGCSTVRTFRVGEISLTIDINITATDQVGCSIDGSAFVNEVLLISSVNPTSSADPETLTYELLDASLNIVANAGNGRPSSPFTNLAAGQYFIRASQGGANNCSSNLVPFTIKDQSTDPIVSITKVSDQFSNNTDPSSWTGALTAQVSESPGNPLSGTSFSYTYAWYTAAEYPSGISFSDQADVNGLDEGNYFVRVTNNQSGCSSVASYFISRVIVPPVAQYSINVPATCLSDASIELTQLEQRGIVTDYSDFEFRLYLDTYPDNQVAAVSSPASNMLFEDLDEGVYYVSVYNTNLNIEGEIIQLNIIKNTYGPVLNLDFGLYKDQQSCDPATPNGILAVEAYESDYSIGDYGYQWYQGNRVDATRIIDGATNRSLENLAVGFYTVEVTNQNTACVSSQTFYVSEDSSIPVVSATSSENTFCDPALVNGSVSAQVTFANGRELSGNSNSGFRFDWYEGQQAVGSPFVTGKTQENLAPGLYTVLAIDLQNGSCISEPVTVEVRDASLLGELNVIVENPQQNCDPALANGRLSASLNQANAAYEFRWYNEQNEVISNSSSVQGLATGNYRVEATNLVTGCVLQAEASVNEEIKTIASPSITINSHQTRCDEPDGTVTAMIPSLISEYEFFWYDASGNRLPVEEPATKLSGLSAGLYTLQLRELRSGCLSEIVEFEILDETFAPIYQVYTEPAICDTKSGLIRIIPEDITAIDRVEWYSTFGNDVLAVGMEVTEMFAGEYRYEVFAVNGCSSSGTVIVEADINVFNGLSPNGDGENDYFHIDCMEKFPENNVKIFNRAGALIYEADYYDNMSTFFEGVGNRGIYVGGKELPDGTYFYVVDKKDGSKPKTGYLELTW